MQEEDSSLGRVLSGLRISIPRKFAQRLLLKKGDLVIVELEGRRLVVIPADVKPKVEE